LFTVSIFKGENGLGMDINKMPDGGCIVKKIKEFPAGQVNPATACQPPVMAGDVIVGVNGKRVKDFAEVVKAVKSVSGAVMMTFERK
jgi:S1-C subfamily serine protease